MPILSDIEVFVEFDLLGRFMRVSEIVVTFNVSNAHLLDIGGCSRASKSDKQGACTVPTQALFAARRRRGYIHWAHVPLLPLRPSDLA